MTSRIKGLALALAVAAGAVSSGRAEEGWLKEHFGDTLVNAAGEKVDVSKLAGKKVGIYFSAHWCPPCRAFTPVLVQFFNDLQKEGKDFALVFVSSDRDEKAMAGYMTEMKMPWLAVPFDSAARKQLGAKYEIRGIPSLVILDKDGKVVSKNARGEVQSLGVKAFDKW